MNFEDLTQSSVLINENDSKIPTSKAKAVSLPNVQPKNSIKIPDSAKRIGNYILGTI